MWRGACRAQPEDTARSDGDWQESWRRTRQGTGTSKDRALRAPKRGFRRGPEEGSVHDGPAEKPGVGRGRVEGQGGPTPRDIVKARFHDDNVKQIKNRQRDQLFVVGNPVPQVERYV